MHRAASVRAAKRANANNATSATSPQHMIITILEIDNGRLSDSSCEALTGARRLAAQCGATLSALLIGAAAAPHLELLAAYGVSVVYQVADERLADYAPE